MKDCRGCGHCTPEKCTECLGYDPFPSDTEMKADYERILKEELMKEGEPCEMCGTSPAVLDGLCKSCTMEVTELTGEEVDSLIHMGSKEHEEFVLMMEDPCETCKGPEEVEYCDHCLPREIYLGMRRNRNGSVTS
jgi:hypothetical protein